MRHDLVLGRGLLPCDRNLAAREPAGDRGYLEVRDIAIVAIECLTRDFSSIGKEQNLDGSGHVRGVNFLASVAAFDRFFLDHASDQRIPLARSRRVCEPVNARRPQRTDWPALAEPVTVHECLDRGLVSTIMARHPERMRFIEGPVGHDLLMHGAARDEDETADPGLARRLDEPDCSHHVRLDELHHVPLATSESALGTIERGMNHRVSSLNQVPRAIVITEAAFNPGDRAPRQRRRKVTEVARRAVPAEEAGAPRRRDEPPGTAPENPLPRSRRSSSARLSSSLGITLGSSKAAQETGPGLRRRLQSLYFGVDQDRQQATCQLSSPSVALRRAHRSQTPTS